jgi:SAM-dependent methyltransferase
MTADAGSRAAHWDSVHALRDPAEFAWFQAEPTVSLELVDALEVGPDAAVVDVGGGSSRLVDRLLDRGFGDVTVLDVSSGALDVAQGRLGDRAARVTWLVEDVCAWRPGRRYDLWHDRAVLHFLVDAADRARYLDALELGLASGGAAVIATFASDGPEQCSGLPVVRYDPPGLAALLGPGLRLVAERRAEHRTPGGAVQPFAWAALRRAR